MSPKIERYYFIFHILLFFFIFLYINGAPVSKSIEVLSSPIERNIGYSVVKYNVAMAFNIAKGT